MKHNEGEKRIIFEIPQVGMLKQLNFSLLLHRKKRTRGRQKKKQILLYTSTDVLLI